ncbi:MAG: DUF3105 domain-containing protein [bacterium]
MILRHLNIILFSSLLWGCADDTTTAVPDAETDAGVDADIMLACDGVIASQPLAGANHVSEPTEITYDVSPPASGPHRPFWARWGEYAVLPPQIYVHNLEHGGVALLYRPDAPQADIDGLREFAKVRDSADGGTFRWILTPYDGLPTPVAAVAWGWVYEASCFDADGLNVFLSRHYRQAPEDIGSDGAFSDGFIGRL